MISEFTCTYNGLDMCLFNSTCAPSGNSCEDCSPGFTNDFSFFHQPNCGMPANTLIVFLGIYTSIWFITGTYAVINFWKVKNKAMIALGWETMVYHCSIEVIVVGLAIQTGMFEVALSGLLLFNIAVFRLIVRLVIQMFTFRSGINKHLVYQVSKAFDWLKIVHAIIIVAFGIATIALCRGDAFDTIIFAYEVVQLAMMNAVVMIMVRCTKDFLEQLKKIPDSQDTPEMQKEAFEDVRKRVLAMARRWAILLGLLPILATIGFAMRLILNSIPYMFVIYLSGHIWTPALTVGVVSLFPRMRTIQSIGESTKSDNAGVTPRVLSSKESSRIEGSARSERLVAFEDQDRNS